MQAYISYHHCSFYSSWEINLNIRVEVRVDANVDGLTITKTCLYNFDPLKPHFYIVKLGFRGVYITLLISAQKHRLWVRVRTASARRF